MIEAAILSLIFLDVGILAVSVGRAFKKFQPTQALDEEETFNSFQNNFDYNSQINSMNEPANRGANHNAQTKPEQPSPNFGSDSDSWQWEFKIVRGSANGFRGREALSYVCEQERMAGWILLEKLDNQRLRFRRPIAARKIDHLCRQDPYRTYYGMPPELSSLISLLVVLALLGIPAYWGFSFILKQLPLTESKVLDGTTTPIKPLPEQPKR
jgi:hypothetical protein